MHIVIYDLEIQKPVKNNDAAGWAAAKRGEHGVASLVCYDNLTERYHLYDDYTFETCADHLNSADLLVSFNGKDFDRPCFEGYTGHRILPIEFDIKEAIYDALGTFKRGYRLGQLCERMFGEAKSAKGESAPKLFADGRYGELFDYNLNDVYLTRKLYNHIVAFGTVIRPDGSPLQLLEYPDEKA